MIGSDDLDTLYMKQALDLAIKGQGYVKSNPLVGAVIVKDGRIIGEGYHMMFGEAHAEVNAINQATESVEGATMYVTLEPCSHYGKTPPCSQLIIKKKLARVVIASVDPNPLVAGKGIAHLKEAGIEVTTNILDADNKALNKVFFKYIKTKLPYVIMKTAMTADGKIATKDFHSKWITNTHSRAYVHELRHQYQGIMVGINTVHHDNPILTSRTNKSPSSNPVRIIVDSKLSIKKTSQIIQTAKTIPTIILTTDKAAKEKVHALESLGATIIVIDVTKEGRVDLNKAMQVIGEYGISSLLLEGGSTLNYAALQSNIVDEVISFIAPKIFGGQKALTPVGGDGISLTKDAFKLTLTEVKQFDDDVCLLYNVNKEGD